MKTSTDRILTTHVGSLPRSKAVTDAVFAHEAGNDLAGAAETIRDAVDAVVKRQSPVEHRPVGVDCIA